ncbi:MAG: pyridoxal-phosphate dependent enzyme [Anaerolineae bacterium]|nr:pyridoxal-phosphate dependent enzyme [Anaerolineae bacterium]
MLSLTNFQTAEKRISPYVSKTPSTFDEKYSLHLKWESHQPTHSFKVRGAFNKILAMESPAPLFVSGSAGNHGQAVALAAQTAGVQAWVFVPENTPSIKVNRMLELGARVELVPGLFGDAEAKAIRTRARWEFHLFLHIMTKR